MFWSIVAAILVLIAVLFLVADWVTGYRTASQGERLLRFWAGFCLLSAVLSLFVGGVIGTGIGYYEQIEDIEALQMYEENEAIYAEKAEALTQQFAVYLAEMYPEHEADIFDRISPNGIDVYLVKYPEIQSSQTLLALVSEISGMESDRYDQRLERARAEKRIRARLRSPFYFTRALPTR